MDIYYRQFSWPKRHQYYLKLHTNPTSITGTSLYNMDNYLYSSLGPKDTKPHTKLTPRF